MIEVCYQLANCDRLATWLDSIVRPHLTPDVSNYAKGRLRCWLRVEPPLSSQGHERKGLPCDDTIWNRLEELMGWQFDFALITYSGDETGIGIGAHRDASYADYEARSLHISGECRFDYWQGRDAFGFAPNHHEFNPKQDVPTKQLLLQPGQVVRFNCKNLHAATPGAKRWNLNTWRRKINR